MAMPGTLKYLPSCSIGCTLAGSVKTPVSVVLHRVVFPRAFQQLVDHFEVLVGVVVALVVLHLVFLAHVAGGRGQVPGDDVPAHAALGQVVQGGQAAGERVRVLVGGARGDAEARGSR